MGHPCSTCGACCASFRVAFHWSESDSFPGGMTPSALTERLDPHRLAMRGTQARAPHCIALQGVVGEHTQCSIYTHRPSPCRDLKPAWEFGQPSPQCDRARIAHGLPPLDRGSWPASGEIGTDLGEVLLPMESADVMNHPEVPGDQVT